jgi:hypothetical protein
MQGQEKAMTIEIDRLTPEALSELARALVNGNVLFVKSISVPTEGKVTAELVVGPRWKDIR